MSIAISLVIPFYNEEENLPHLSKRVSEVMDGLGRSYECVFVDDGSTDHSARVILDEKKKNPRFRLVRLGRNFGQTAALAAGFDHSEGEIVVTLDADLQNDPADIPMMIGKLEEGYDLVSGWRQRREDPVGRRVCSGIANRLISWVTRVQLHDSGCTLKVYRRSVVRELRLYGEMHRFIPALASWAGISLTEVPVSHHPRTRGRSKYGFSRIVRVFLDLITVKFLLSYSASPIQIFGKIGLASSLVGLVSLAAAVFLKIVESRTLTGNPLFYFFMLMEIIGIQFIVNGLIAETSIRTYYESQKKKTYWAKEVE